MKPSLAVYYDMIVFLLSRFLIVDASLNKNATQHRKIQMANGQGSHWLIESTTISPNINEEDKRKLQNAVKEVSKGECIIMGDFNRGHVQRKSLESTKG